MAHSLLLQAAHVPSGTTASCSNLQPHLHSTFVLQQPATSSPLNGSCCLPLTTELAEEIPNLIGLHLNVEVLLVRG
eukprot:CAMPEP_0177463462 /NCGR_PEP_ID=MMETSP0369-20130122/16318_1 /TAXON_ID=447022 ORGANISM="Scrippsiella hangoei-like, Strain SHHI-4" /NCGR_SAMPLE_ID=MMETSP0369 /ASSEMBLY_ACC=CAM_ASM_000364 /LENGTH=75 /DNA_ID=CAMNT_0018937131 /DNA_START=10 /DNA_END=233 /DNA_ORIENTATION=-